MHDVRCGIHVYEPVSRFRVFYGPPGHRDALIEVLEKEGVKHGNYLVFTPCNTAGYVGEGDAPVRLRTHASDPAPGDIDLRHCSGAIVISSPMLVEDVRRKYFEFLLYRGVLGFPEPPHLENRTSPLWPERMTGTTKSEVDNLYKDVGEYMLEERVPFWRPQGAPWISTPETPVFVCEGEGYYGEMRCIGTSWVLKAGAIICKEAKPHLYEPTERPTFRRTERLKRLKVLRALHNVGFVSTADLASDAPSVFSNLLMQSERTGWGRWRIKGSTRSITDWWDEHRRGPRPNGGTQMHDIDVIPHPGVMAALARADQAPDIRIYDAA